MSVQVESKVLAGFLVTWLVLGLVGALAFQNMRGLAEANHQLKQSNDVLRTLEIIFSGVKEMESAARGYVITGNEHFLEPMGPASRVLSAESDQLMALVRPGSEESRLAHELVQKIDERAEHSKQVIRLRKEEGEAKAAALIATGRGMRLTEEIRALIDQIEGHGRTALQARQQAVAQGVVITTWTIVFSGLASMVFLAAAYLFVRRDMRSRRAAEEALRLAHLEVSTRARDLERRNRDITLLNELAEILQVCRSLDEAYPAIGKQMEKMFPGLSGTLSLTHQARNLVEVAAHWGSAGLLGEAVYEPNDCLGLRSGRPQLVAENLNLHCGHVTAAPGERYMAVPMLAQGETLGALHFHCSDPAKSEEELNSYRQLALLAAEHVGLAVGSLRLRETLRNQSIRDPLTGLFNRRYMEESLEREIARAGRNQRSVGLVMLDIDHFKRFNDTFGHEAGDILLRELGQLLRRLTRSSDIACRLGGEEFTLIMPEATLEIVCHRADLIMETVRQLNVHHRGQSLGQVTISQGVAVCPGHGTERDLLLRAADAALYRAKREGRDRIAVAEAATQSA